MLLRLLQNLALTIPLGSMNREPSAEWGDVGLAWSTLEAPMGRFGWSIIRHLMFMGEYFSVSIVPLCLCREYCFLWDRRIHCLSPQNFPLAAKILLLLHSPSTFLSDLKGEFLARGCYQSLSSPRSLGAAVWAWVLTYGSLSSFLSLVFPWISPSRKWQWGTS